MMWLSLFLYFVYLSLFLLFVFLRKVLYNLFLFLTDFKIHLVFQGLLSLSIFNLFCFLIIGKFASYTPVNNFWNSLYAFSGSFNSFITSFQEIFLTASGNAFMLTLLYSL